MVDLVRCPRCNLILDRDRQVPQQVERCAFCKENYRRLCTGRVILKAPTVEFPAGSDS